MYAIHASAEFNYRLGAAVRQLAAEVRDAMGANLIALVLGGGYGRGEGGVITRNNREEPYNDLDLVLIVKHKFFLPWPRLSAICARYQSRLGIHVDLSRPLTPRDIRQWPHALMWQDLLNGHIVVTGPAEIIKHNAPRGLQNPLPRVEALRLLLNRGAGLLWALRVAQGLESEPDGDFVRRNYYKCALALGDALLIGYRQFVSSYAQRDGAFTQLCAQNRAVAALGLRALYNQAVSFKFSPDALAAAQPGAAKLRGLAADWGRIVLHLERRRTGIEWRDLSDYAQWRGARERAYSGAAQALRNFARNRKAGEWSWRHPREHLYRSLPQLLGVTGEAVRAWPERTGQWLRVWRQFN